MPRTLVQRFSNGQTEAIDVAVPQPGPREVVVQNVASLVSAGTERMLLDFGRASLLDKARQQPQRVGEVVSKVRTDGLMPTVDAVRSKLSTPTTLGYASAGVVLATGSAVGDLAPGTLVATNGNHAEVVVVPRTFCAPVPDGVTAEDACFATVASVGLQGIRLAEPQLGERFVVMGLGLIGLLVVQLLRAQGCAVLGVDVDEDRLKLAESFGASIAPAGDGAEAAASSFSAGRGVDGVIICAATKSSDLIHQAAQMCRRRARVVLVGVTGLELDRADFYEKELSFQVSCSYGPGKYEPSYESGRDYPLGVARWTAGRNMEAVIDQLAAGTLQVTPLISHRFPFEDASAAYDALLEDPAALGIVLEYAQSEPARAIDSPVVTISETAPLTSTRPIQAAAGSVAVIGAGNFASQVLIPAIVAAGGHLAVVASRRGTDATVAANRFSGCRATTDVSSCFTDDGVDTVVVASRHDSHADYVTQALEAGKHVFVEKPLAITSSQLDAVEATLATLAHGEKPSALLGVGFNRRFSPVTVRMKELLQRAPGPKALILTMNAGSLPADHWTRDPAVGGGRIIGEAVHLIDLARFLAGTRITEVTATHLDPDSATITLAFEDESMATVHYLANGAKRFPKERIEVFGGGKVLVNENFRRLRSYGFPGARPLLLRRQDKGHVAGMKAFLDAVRDGGPAPIPADEIIEVHRAALAAAGR